IDLSGMQAGDTVNIRISKRIASGGAWLVGDTVAYNDAQPAGHSLVHIGMLAAVYGVKIEMQQTAGVLRTITCDFLHAKRLGL
ncbi:MAG: hypothetical protein PHW65_01630, partial [Dehalococcoidales bacterium]|nr:hypothetical protein [Dehalococcoidales bacterium]